MDLMVFFFKGQKHNAPKTCWGDYHRKMMLGRLLAFFSTRAPFSRVYVIFRFRECRIFFLWGVGRGSVWSTREWFLLKNGIGRFDDVKQSIRVNHMPFRKLPQHSDFFLTLQENYGPKLEASTISRAKPLECILECLRFLGPSGFFFNSDACHYTRTTSQVRQSDLFGMVK